MQVGADGLLAAGGYYQMAPDQVARFRTAVDDDRRGDDLEAAGGASASGGITIGGETLKTRPRGVDPDHPRLELLRHRGLYGWRRWPPDDVLHERGGPPAGGHRVAGAPAAHRVAAPTTSGRASGRTAR